MMLIFEGNLRSGEVTEPLHRGLNPFLDQGPARAEQLNLDDCLAPPRALLPGFFLRHPSTSEQSLLLSPDRTPADSGGRVPEGPALARSMAMRQSTLWD